MSWRPHPVMGTSLQHLLAGRVGGVGVGGGVGGRSAVGGPGTLGAAPQPREVLLLEVAAARARSRAGTGRLRWAGRSGCSPTGAPPPHAVSGAWRRLAQRKGGVEAAVWRRVEAALAFPAKWTPPGVGAALTHAPTQ